MHVQRSFNQLNFTEPEYFYRNSSKKNNSNLRTKQHQLGDEYIEGEEDEEDEVVRSLCSDKAYAE